MATINVYEQYFEAECMYNGVERKGALVALISNSEAGSIAYEATVSFFPHRDAEDYAVSYDAYFAKEIYSGTGRRSKKREKQFLEPEGFRRIIDELAEEHSGKVFWDCPLREARLG